MIEFWHGLQQGPVLDTFHQIVHEWNTRHPDNQVQAKAYTTYDAPAKEALSVEDAQQPNVILAPEYMTGRLMTALGEKKVIPIHQLLPSEQLDKIADIVKRTFGDKDGRLMSLPFNPACGVLFANGDVVKTMPKTLEELEKISKELIKNGQVKNGYTCAWPAAYLVEVPAAQQDIPLVTPNNGKSGFGQYVLGKEWLYRHLLDLRRMQKEEVFIYAGGTNDACKPFIKGEVAFFMQGSTHHGILQQEASFNVIAAPLPTLTRGQTVKNAFPLGGASIWVLDNVKTRSMLNGVKEFLTYLASDGVQEKWHKETAYVPALKDLPTKLADFYQDHPLHQAVVAQTIQATLGEYSFGIHMPNYAEARKELFQLIEQVLDEKTSDEQVMSLLQAFDTKYSIPDQ